MSKLGYTSERFFLDKNKDELKTLGFNPKKLTEREICLTHYYRESKAVDTKYTLQEQYDAKRFDNKFNKIRRNINRRLSEKENETQYKIRQLYTQIVGNDFILIADFNQLKTEQKPSNFSEKRQAKHKVERNRQTRGYFSLSYNQTDNTVKAIFGRGVFVSDWILNSLGLHEVTVEEKVSWSTLFNNMLSNRSYEVTSLYLKKTDVNRRDVLILKPTRASSLYEYIEDLKKAGIIKNPNLSYIGKLYVRLPGGSTHQIEFTRPDDLSIKPMFRKKATTNVQEMEQLQSLLGFRDKHILVDNGIDPLDDIFDNIGTKRLIKSVEVSKYRSYDVLAGLEDTNLIKVGKTYVHTCRSKVCVYNVFENKRRLKICKDCGHKRLYIKEIAEVFPQYKTIAKQIVKLLNRNGMKAKQTKAIPYSSKYNFIITKYLDEDIFLFTNSIGISKRIEDELLIGMRPFVIMDFRGELNETLSQYGHVSGGHILRALKEGKVLDLQEAIKKSVDTYKGALLPSLKRSTEKLIDIRDKNADSTLSQGKKGPMFEKLVHPTFSLLFNAKPLGSKNRPDGVFFLNSDDYVLWDSKRYDSDKSTLLRYIKGKLRTTKGKRTRLPKDIRYIQRALTFDKVLKRNLSYYMFITKNISQKDFDESRDLLNKFSRKVNKKVKIVCLDFGGLIVLNEFLLNPKYLDVISKEKDRFVGSFRNVLDSKGFVTTEDITNLLESFKKAETVKKMDEYTFTKSS